jgi:hypothetical protein
MFVGLAQAREGHSEEYYIYQDPSGKLVISNQTPPPGSKIIKQQNLPEATESQTQPTQGADDVQPKGDSDDSLKPSKNK